jgi:hypothetical protein
MFSQPFGPLNRATLTGQSNERHSLFPRADGHQVLMRSQIA